MDGAAATDLAFIAFAVAPQRPIPAALRLTAAAYRSPINGHVLDAAAAPYRPLMWRWKAPGHLADGARSG